MSHTVILACCLRLTGALLTLAMACDVCARTNAAAATDPVWRCATPPGTAVAYQATPCRDGGQNLPRARRPSPEDQKASARVAKREASLARNMGRQRQRREKDMPTAHASLSGPVRQVSVGHPEENRAKARGQHADRAARRARPQRDDVFRAEVPSRPRERSKPLQAEAVSASPP